MISTDISIFHHKSANFAISRTTDIDCISNSFNFFYSFKIVLINMVTLLITSAKMANLHLFEVKIFWNKGYDVISFVQDVMRQKFGNSSISIREFIIISASFGFGPKNHCFEGLVFVQIH